VARIILSCHYKWPDPGVPPNNTELANLEIDSVFGYLFSGILRSMFLAAAPARGFVIMISRMRGSGLPVVLGQMSCLFAALTCDDAIA